MAARTQLDRKFAIRLDSRSGVPVYRQIIDQVMGGIAAQSLQPGTQLPTVRQLAVDLAINPNTVIRAYRELEIRGVIDTQHGTGTFISAEKPRATEPERRRRIAQLAGELLARAGAEGISLQDLLDHLHELQHDQERERRS
ncbi:MAG TPA: GntR family transcriptional regulator [Bryobacteraceae bacterium]|nr:GntR family transcriptional regulator [Bryobacteraceae bacterium]